MPRVAEIIAGLIHRDVLQYDRVMRLLLLLSTCAESVLVP